MEVLPILVLPSARIETTLLAKLSKMRVGAVTPRRITLFLPFSLSPAPQTTILPSTFTFSSVTSPRPRPPVIYRFPAMVVSRSVTPEVEIVTLPYTPPSVCVPDLLTGVPMAFTRRTAICPRVMLCLGLKDPSP
ncbi:hypothetical protein DSECCO2_447550 [anaerobic digester metagenome]